MTINNITVLQSGRVIIYFSNGGEVETNLDSTCISTLDADQYDALTQFIENEPDRYFSVLDEIKSMY